MAGCDPTLSVSGQTVVGVAQEGAHIGRDNRCMVLLCYDGSPDAQAAVERAGELMRGHSAMVLTVWEGLGAVLARTRAGYSIGALNLDEIDAESEQRARRMAEDGVQRAGRAGLIAQLCVRERGVRTWETILEVADELDASAIILGSRGLTGAKSLLLGSVSHAVLQHAARPVIVVPSPEIATKRAAHRR